ncbi:DUF255 domain-containing protein [Clostridium sp.]
MIKTTKPNDLIYKKINMFSWCNETFKKAKDENKPIFLSIGYS